MMNKITYYLLCEHNSPELLFKMLDIPFKGDYSKIDLQFVDEKIYVSGPNINYVICFYDEEYVITSVYNNYRYIRHYEYDKSLFRKITRFEIDSENDLVLDELLTDQLSFRRMLVTPCDDEELDREIFEREVSENKRIGLNEEFLKVSNDENYDYHVSKDIYLEDNFYCYHKDTFIDPLQVNFMACDVEVACCIKTPLCKFVGRFDNPKDAMHTAVSGNYPSIIVNGNYYYMDNGVPTKAVFLLTVVLIDGLFDVSLINVTKKNGVVQNSYEVGGSSFSTIQSDDIDYIINGLKGEKETKLYMSYLEKELLRVKDSLMAKEHKKSKDLDFFVAKMKMYPKYEELAFDMYVNLEQYKEWLYKSDTRIIKGNETMKK